MGKILNFLMISNMMKTRKIKLQPRRQAILDQRKNLRGEIMHYPISMASVMWIPIRGLLHQMIQETAQEIKQLFAGDYAGDYGMDAENIGSQARMAINRLSRRWDYRFSRIAKLASEQMIDRADKSSKQMMKTSIQKLTGNLEFSPDVITAPMREMIAARTAEAASLIKRVPARYLDSISTTVYEAITTGRGLADIKPALEKYGVQTRNWAHNVSLDQTRKTYNGLNASRMQAIGVQEYEWVHSGGSNQPRPYHRDVLNGKIFRLDDPPIIDQRTGERGKPGDAPFCRCTMRPIVSFGRKGGTA